METFAQLDALVREVLPQALHGCDPHNGVIAIMGTSPNDAFVYRCGRDSCGDAGLPTGWHTYFVVRDTDQHPQTMSDWSAYSRRPCSWDEMAAAVRLIAEKRRFDTGQPVTR